MEIAIGALIAVAAGILTPPIAKIIELWWRNRISVKRITNPKDKKNINQLIELYCEIFPDGFNAEELYEYIHSSLAKPNERPTDVEDFWLVARRGSNIVGFFFCHYYPKRKKAWVSYYGIVKPKEPPKETTSIKSLLLEEVLSYIKKRDCEYLFFDTERKSRIRLFRKDAKINGVKAFELKFDYKAPKKSVSEARPDSKLLLMVIPLIDSFKSPIPQTKVIDFLDFIYLDCYGDIYEKTDPRFEKYNKYLTTKLAQVKKTIPEAIEIE